MDLITNAEKRTSEEQVAEFYKRRNEILLKQNIQLKKLATDINASGGIVDTKLARGTLKKDFETPYSQSLIAEEMANEGFFALALQQFTSLCSQVEVELNYNNTLLAKDNTHKKVLDFVKEQISNIGGYKVLFKRIIAPALRWGVGIGLPELYIDHNNMIGLKSIRTINMQNIQQFIFDKNDTTRVAQIKYISYPKIINTGLENQIDTKGNSKTETTNVEYITLDLKSNCVGIYSHNVIDGNPFGNFYLSFLYSDYKLYKMVKESLANAVYSFGQYPLGVKRTSTESGIDYSEWENNAIEKLKDLMSAGGGVFVDGEGEIYNLTPPDTSHMTSSLKDIFDITMRTANLGQITSGIDGGGSRNLTESMDNMTSSFVNNTIKSACISISETMIKYLCDLNFKKYYRTGKLKEYPYLIVKDKNNIVQEIINTTGAQSCNPVPQPTQTDTILQNKTEKVQQGILTDVIKQEGYTTSFKLVKQDPTETEKELIINVKALDDILSKSVEDLSNTLQVSLKPKLKEALEKIFKNPKANLNVWGLFDKKRFMENVHKELEHIIKNLAIEESKYIQRAFELGNTTFEEVLGESVDSFINKTVNSYMKSNTIKNIENGLLQSATQYVRDYATKVNNGFALNSKEARLEGLKRALSDVDDLKGVDFNKMSEMEVMKTFTSLSEHQNKEALKKSLNKNYVMVRSGILENQCEHCKKKMGEVYYLSDDGENFISEDGDYATFPDPRCTGMKYGHSCRCFGLLSPKSILGKTVK